MRPRSKSQLIEYLSGAQIICLAIALVIFGGWIKRQVGQVIRQQIFEENELIAQQFGRLLRTLHTGELVFGDSAWEHFQTIVEDTKLPNDGYLCIADVTTGNLLCHPRIREQPSLRSLSLRHLSVATEQKRNINLFRAAAESKENQLTVTGLAGQGAKTEIVSATHLPNIRGILFVHQAEASTQAAVQRILTPLGYSGVVIGGLLVLVSTKFAVRVIKGFEHELESINASLEQTIRQRTLSLLKTRNAVIFGLARLAESRDSDTGEHLERISLYSTLLAEAHAARTSEVDREFIGAIGLASSLHDIGKVGVPDHVLLKPGKLTADERLEIEVHPRVGQACLDAIDSHLESDAFLTMAREICAFHHEKWDGSGYPYGKQGTDIPIAARIVAVADVYDALRSKRPYKSPLSHSAACQIIRDSAGSHFDPDVVLSFFAIHREFEAISTRFLEPVMEEECHSMAAEPIDKSSHSAPEPIPVIERPGATDLLVHNAQLEACDTCGAQVTNGALM